jgi:ATP-dependent Lhr-like helicase
MDPKVPAYAGGGKFPLSTYLADQVRGMLADPSTLACALPEQVARLAGDPARRTFPSLPKRDELLVETFPYRQAASTWSPIPSRGRLAHQTLGMLLTRRLERAGRRPLGFVATDYSLAIWAHRRHRLFMFKPSHAVARLDLFDEDMLGDDLEAWLDESFMLKRTFRNCAVIPG